LQSRPREPLQHAIRKIPTTCIRRLWLPPGGDGEDDEDLYKQPLANHLMYHQNVSMAFSFSATISSDDHINVASDDYDNHDKHSLQLVLLAWPMHSHSRATGQQLLWTQRLERVSSSIVCLIVCLPIRGGNTLGKCFRGLQNCVIGLVSTIPKLRPFYLTPHWIPCQRW
jgi:hypothetical protein